MICLVGGWLRVQRWVHVAHPVLVWVDLSCAASGRLHAQCEGQHLTVIVLAVALLLWVTGAQQ